MNEETTASIDKALTEDEKNELHKIAITAIEKKLRNESPSIPKALTDTLNEKRGAFVSLHKGGKLRGCIGYVHAVKPLAETINEMALAAAFQDPRFPSLEKDELSDLDIELSVLTPMKQIKEISEIEVGKHGLMMIKGPYSGLLLPQVALQYNWDKETFLSQTCNKAGLPSDAWKDDDMEIYIFSAEIF